MTKKNGSKNLHQKNMHRNGYNLEKLAANHTELKPFLFVNSFGNLTLDFANPKSVKALNTALLKFHYGIDYWEFPDENLCPPIPGRVDYIHHLNDLLQSEKLQNSITILDIGSGATCIYPILGNSVYGWNFIGTDIDKNSIDNAQQIINKNSLASNIKLRYQTNKDNIFDGIIESDELFNDYKDL